MPQRETWCPVVGWVGFYEVSDFGRVRNSQSGFILKPIRSSTGHMRVTLYNPTAQLSIHVMVLSAFVGPPPVGAQCRHLNDVKDDNRLINLKWGSASENRTDQVVNGVDPRSKQTRCNRDHPLTNGNLRINCGTRRCRSCSATHSWFRRNPHVDRDMFDDVAATYLWKFSAEKEAAA